MATVLQIDAYDPVAAAAVTLRAASHDDDRVCNLNGQVWWPTITKLPSLANDLFDGAFDSGSITDPSSSLTLSSEPWPSFGRYTFGDARIQIWTGEPTDAWASWVKRADARVSSQPKLQDWSADFDIQTDSKWLDTPLLTAYAGSGGIEGGTDLTGSFKPLALGVPQFVSGTLIDSVNSVFQISGYGAIQSVDVAFDKLVRFNAAAADYATYAALVAATIPAGSWATCLAFGLVRFGAPPAGQVSFHVHGDIAGTDGLTRTAGKMIRRLAILSGGTGKVNDASLNALDTARPWNLSLDVTDQTTARDLIQSIAASVNAVAGVAWTGGLFVAPVGTGSPTLTLMADGSAAPQVSVVSQANMNTPYWRLAIQAQKTWTVHSLTDIASTVTFNPRGNYDATTVYRQGDIVTNPDGSKWQYTSTTAASGHAPPNATYWTAWDTSAQTALDRLAAIESDSVLSAGEKPDVIQDVTAIQNEKPVYDAQADSLAVSRTTYDSAYTALQTYLSGLSPAWNDATQDTAIVAATFNGKFTDYYYARAVLLNAIAQASAQAVPTVNRVKLSLYERGTLGWAMNDNPSGTNPVLSVSTVSGKAVLGLSYTAQTGKAVSYGTNHPGYNFTVTPGEILACSGFVGGTGTGAQGIALLFVNAAGSVVSQTESLTVPLNAAFPTQVGLILPVPPAAVTAFVLLYLNPTANGAATASLSQVMVSSVSSAQTGFPVFVPGPNALDGADQTSQNTAADTTNVGGVPAATVNANITAAANLASTANATAAIGAQLASDVADNNKFSSTEKKRWVEKIAALNTTVPAEVSQANALGLNAQATALNAAFTALTGYLSATVSGGPTSNTPPPNYLDTAHTSAISSNTFKSYVDNFEAAETALTTAAQNYSQILSIGTTANLFTDDSFTRFVTSNAEWLQISGFVSQPDTAGQRIVSTAGVGEAIAMAAPFSLSVNDRIDIQFEYYVDSNVPNTGTFGAYLQIFDANANLLGSFGIALAFNIVTRNTFVKMTGSFYVSQAVVQSGQNLANAAVGHIYLECQNHTAGNVYLRKPSALQTPNALANLNSNGRGTTALLNSTSVVAGIKILNNTGFVLSSTANGTTNVNINIAAFTYTTDTGVTLSYPSATIVGAPFSTTFYVWRIDPNLDGGTGYSVSQSLTDAAKPGNLYLGYLTTPSSAGTGGGGGGGGASNCVMEGMWIDAEDGPILAKDLKVGSRIWALTEDRTGCELVEVESNDPGTNICLRIIAASGARLALAVNTPMDLRDGSGSVMAMNAWSIDVASRMGGELGWGACTIEAIHDFQPVRQILCGGRMFFAGENPSQFIASHNGISKY